MIRKKLVMLTVVLSLAAMLSACDNVDVVGKTAVTSFDSLTQKLGDQVAYDDSKGSWVITSAAGDTFMLSKDFSSDVPDTAVEFDATPFINAGLKVEELPKDQYIYNEETGRIYMPHEFSSDAFSYTGEAAIDDTFQKLVDTNRDKIGYHAQLDHYGIAFGDGNMFEWAKDTTTNDKDYVFVLNPQPFIDAGVDVSKVDGWVFGTVKVDNEEGKLVEVEKLLKPFTID
jgi:hypothetical protein